MIAWLLAQPTGLCEAGGSSSLSQAWSWSLPRSPSSWRVLTWVLKWLVGVGISEHVMLLFYEPSKGPSAWSISTLAIFSGKLQQLIVVKLIKMHTSFNVAWNLSQFLCYWWYWWINCHFVRVAIHLSKSFEKISILRKQFLKSICWVLDCFHSRSFVQVI